MTEGEDSQTEIYFWSCIDSCEFSGLSDMLRPDAGLLTGRSPVNISILFLQLLLLSGWSRTWLVSYWSCYSPPPKNLECGPGLFHLFLKKISTNLVDPFLLSIPKGLKGLIFCQVQQGISQARQVKLSEERQREELLGRITVAWMSPKRSMSLSEVWVMIIYEKTSCQSVPYIT